MSPQIFENGYYQNTRNNKRWQGQGEKGSLEHSRWKYKLLQAFLEGSLAIPIKI